MSNNGLWCIRCKSHHHPVESCGPDADTHITAELADATRKIIEDALRDAFQAGVRLIATDGTHPAMYPDAEDEDTTVARIIEQIRQADPLQ